WSSDVCSSDLVNRITTTPAQKALPENGGYLFCRKTPQRALNLSTPPVPRMDSPEVFTSCLQKGNCPLIFLYILCKKLQLTFLPEIDIVKKVVAIGIFSAPEES